MSDNKPVINEEAVEAAYGAINYPGQQAIDREEIRVILEAAAPHMLTDAWEEGFDYGRNESWTPESNPYRSQS